MIGIIDYGLGNVRAFANVCKTLNLPVVIVRQPRELENVSKIILPGVGAFDYAMQKLDQSGMRHFLDEKVLEHHVPVLGVCVGMQILAHSSEEGTMPGLGWIEGVVKRFNFSSSKTPLIIPHMGWNNVKPIRSGGLFEGLEHDARFYFLHSYYFQCQKNEDIIAVADYGGEFTCAVNSGNIFGIQFHPEKSHHCGIQLLDNFAKL